jgi:hypothetical protein
MTPSFVVTMSWIIWAIMVANRRDSRPEWKAYWHEKFCERPRRKAESQQ